MDLVVLHSHMRHLVFLFGAIAFIVPLIAHLRKREMPTWGKMMVRGYTIVLTIQFVIGIVNIVQQWGIPDGSTRYRMEHAFIMFMALGIAHYSAKYMRMPSPVGPRNTMIMIAGSIVLILLGILMLPQGRGLLLGTS